MLILIAKLFVAILPWLSFTCTVKLKLPVAVGLPVITPIVGFKVKPFGRAPDIIDQVKEGTPPETDRDCL